MSFPRPPKDGFVLRRKSGNPESAFLANTHGRGQMLKSRFCERGKFGVRFPHSADLRCLHAEIRRRETAPSLMVKHRAYNHKRGAKKQRCACSSMVEHPAYIGRVLGSSPSTRKLCEYEGNYIPNCSNFIHLNLHTNRCFYLNHELSSNQPTNSPNLHLNREADCVYSIKPAESTRVSLQEIWSSCFYYLS